VTKAFAGARELDHNVMVMVSWEAPIAEERGGVQRQPHIIPTPPHPDHRESRWHEQLSGPAALPGLLSSFAWVIERDGY
jgi:hypothetical protein